MIKQKTEVTFTPQEFRLLNQCVACGKAEKITYGEKCNACIKLKHKHCEVCEVTLRKGVGIFYTYDIREEHRGSEEFVASKEVVYEFTYEVMADPISSEKLCMKCVGWEDRIKNNCFLCLKDFKNSKKNYKLNGNCCVPCTDKVEKKANERLEEADRRIAEGFAKPIFS